jgi:O-antigen/teichoic acid export membrane protein
MSQSNLLIRNVLITYGRMVLTVGLGLYGTRLLFLALTDTDIGIFNVLGASVALIEIIRSSLTVSAMRHLSISIGKQDHGEYATTVNTTYGVFGALAVLVYLVGLACTPLLEYLTIPDDRRAVAFWVYQFALLNISRSTIMAPVNAVFVSHQALGLQALLALPGSCLMVVATSLLFVLPGDRLLNFVVILFVGQTLLELLTAVVCFYKFPISRPHFHLFDRSMIGELSRFAGWSALGNLTWTIRTKGSSIILNLFFGPQVNAAWDAAFRACNYQLSLTSGVQNATAPAVIAAEGAGRRQQAARLTLSCAKYSSLASLFLTVPLVIDAENALTVWLDDPPQYSVPMMQVLVATLLIEALRTGFGYAMQATDDIGEMTRKMFKYNILPVPLACVAFALGAPSTAIVWLILASSTLVTLLLVHFVGRRIGFSFYDWVQQVVTPASLVCVIGLLPAISARMLLEPGLARLLIVGLAFAIAALPTIWIAAIGSEDRVRFLHFARLLMQWRPSTQANSRKL